MHDRGGTIECKGCVIFCCETSERSSSLFSLLLICIFNVFFVCFQDLKTVWARSKNKENIRKVYTLFFYMGMPFEFSAGENCNIHDGYMNLL